MGQYLIDNNIISNYFSEVFTENAMTFIAQVIDSGINISVITEIEALSWINPDKSKEKILREFVNDANVLTISPDVVSNCVAIRRSRKMKTPDAIIAATAISSNLTLVTCDADFNNIKGLTVINPSSMK